jgi:hypothetical protein
MVSSRIILQLLLALGAAVAAPAYYEEEGMHNARELSSLDYPEKRSIMPSHQEYSRGYEDDFDPSARDISPLSVRTNTPSPPPMSASNTEKLKWFRERIPASEQAVSTARRNLNTVLANPNATKKQKDSAKSQLHTAKEALDGHKENVEHYEKEIAAGHKR